MSTLKLSTILSTTSYSWSLYDGRKDGMSNMMVRIDPPEGTVMEEYYLDDMMRCRAGLKFACYHTVPLMDGSQGEAQGTVLRYEPNGLQIWVGRRDLTGDEVNALGQLSQKLFTIRLQRNYVPEALADLERFVRRIGGFQHVEGLDEELEKGAETILASIGTVAPLLRKADTRLVPRENEIKIALFQLGVTLVRSNSHFDFSITIQPPK